MYCLFFVKKGLIYEKNYLSFPSIDVFLPTWKKYEMEYAMLTI